jgi:hypothetical protein
MKTLKFISIVLLAITVNSCVSGQFRPKVTGSGKVVTEDREAGYFNTIKVSSGIDVYLTQGSSESISLEADDNLHEYIKTEINGNTLKIYSDANIRKAKAKVVHVTMKDIDKITVTSAGDVYGKNTINTEELDLSASSAGDIKLDIEVHKVSCNISSAGDITLKGTANDLEANLSSAGDLKAYELTTKTADVSTSSAGDAKITVTEKLIANTSSAGDIYFKGDPPVVDGHSSSAGGIHKK